MNKAVTVPLSSCPVDIRKEAQRTTLLRGTQHPY